jgi:hypothetical protein
MTRGAELTLQQETDLSVETVKAMADICYENDWSAIIKVESQNSPNL